MRTWATALGAAALAILCWLGAYQVGDVLRRGRAALPPVEERAFVPDPGAARFVSLGYNELAADIWWSRTLLYYGDGTLKGFSLRDVEPMIELVNAFDPWFRRPYAWGAYATTFRQKTATDEEYRASVTILERGLATFPEDHELMWLLGMRYYLDLKSADPAEQRRFQEIGADYISRSVRLPGAPADRASLAARLHTKLGQRERALRELREMILTTEDAKAREKLVERYQELADKDRAVLLRRAGDELRQAWQAAMPYAPATLFVIVGPQPVPRRLGSMLRDDLGDTPEIDLGDADPPTPEPGGPGSKDDALWTDEVAPGSDGSRRPPPTP